MLFQNFRSQERRSRERSRPSRVLSLLAGAGSAIAVLVAAQPAQALPLITLSGSLRGLYGSALSDQELNPYGLGLGLRAGVTLPMSLYVGASLDYFFGESDTVGDDDNSRSLLQVLGNLGYDASLGPLTLRPSLGLGFAQSSSDIAGEDISEGDFVLSPGAELLIGLGLLNVSGEVRYNKIFADDADGLILGVGLGFSL